MNKKKYLTLVGIFLLIILIFILGFLISPQEVVDFFGPERSYLLAFMLSFLGGVSTLTSGSFYALMVSLSLTNLNPIILSLMFGTGLFLGDLIFFYLSRKIINNFSDNWQVKIGKIHRQLENKPRHYLWLFVFIYAGFTPFPGDILMFLMASLKYKFKDFALPLFCGSFALGLIIWLFANTGQNFFNFFFLI